MCVIFIQSEHQDLAEKVSELKRHERGLNRQINMFKHMVLVEQEENKKLLEITVIKNKK